MFTQPTAARNLRAARPEFTAEVRAIGPCSRFLAKGRDASALFDATTNPGYNDGDNEITGIHVSNGDPSVGGLLGAKVPQPFTLPWRTFWTQQHGDNVTWEITWSGQRER